jgi:hypothetical protein
MLEALSTPLNRQRTYLLLALCAALALVSGIIGISDNPPGLLCAFLSAVAFFLAFAHPWKTTIQFRRLFRLAGLSFIVSVALHIVFDLLAARAGHPGLLRGLFNGAAAVFFIVALLLCPPALFVGSVGGVIMFWRARHPHSSATPA